MALVRYIVLVVMLVATGSTSEGDMAEDSSLLGIKKSHPVTPGGQEPGVPVPNTDSSPIDQTDLQKTLLDNTHYLRLWTVAHKVTLGIVVVVVSVILSVGGYLLCENLKPARHDAGPDDLQPSGEGDIGAGPTHEKFC